MFFSPPHFYSNWRSSVTTTELIKIKSRPLYSVRSGCKTVPEVVLGGTPVTQGKSGAPMWHTSFQRSAAVTVYLIMANTSLEVLQASPLLTALVFPVTPQAFIMLDEYVEVKLSQVGVTKCNEFKQFSRRET
ncbi:uncharacterized [Tachysurus ichikawai]